GHPSLVEYFNLQVMEPLSDELQTFLLKTSILEWMAPGLCEALIGKKNAQKGFRKVEKMHFFVAIEDQVQPFLRHHPLLAEFLREEATHRFSDEISVLHRKASGWLQKNGFWNEAVEHALKGEDYDTAGRLINQFAPELFRRGELALLKRWLGHFPKFPSKLMLVHAWTEVLSGECENAFRLLGSTKEITLAEKAMLEGYIALSRRDVRRAFERFQAGTEKGGGLDRFFQKGIDLNQGEVQILRGVLGMGGRLNDVDWLYMERMRNLWKHKEPGILGYGSDIVAELLYEQNQLDDLMYFIIRGIELGKRHENIGVLVSIHLVYIRLKKIERKVNEVWAIYENIKRIVEKSGSKKWLPVLKAFEVRMMLWEGDGNEEELDRWMVDCEMLEPNSPDFAREFETLTLVRVLMFRKQYSRAQRLLKKWLGRAEQIERVGSQIEMLILLALVFQKRGKTNQAFLHIRRALHLAEPEGYIRSFLDEGYPLAELLASVLQKDGILANCPRLLAYIERLMLLFEGEIGVCHWNESNQALIEPLTQRELDILGYIEKGLANSEIAGRLGIQTGTVKGYIVNLYGKLGVQSRVKAAGKAKELGLVKK
ncbi:MAG TPA: LuxR C-terminal-related transcriptional regulator, partial [Bacillales bacterium]